MNQIRNYSDALIRVAPNSDGRKLVGLAIPYNSTSRNLGGFVERFLPGSVTDAIKTGDVQAVLNHNREQTLGTQKGKTLQLRDTNHGIEVEIDIPDTSYARDASALIARGDGTGMSFAFGCNCFLTPNVIRGGDCQWVKDGDKNLHEVRRVSTLAEISVLTGPPPAYSATNIAIRSAEQNPEEAADLYGIDLEALASVFLAIKRGLTLSESETQVMHQARSLFATIRRPLLEAAEDKASKMLL